MLSVNYRVNVLGLNIPSLRIDRRGDSLDFEPSLGLARGVMKILVTGCAGFIGCETARSLLERGDEVFGLDSLNNYYDVRLKEDRLKRIA
ncbi:MAG: NAD-dependent epimerase/dehydratase family protein, partial [Bdellovibrionales bacterium]|nr:NAD-dependent epimerase/dehydratase family protein [Bdellovibrionales bacterium]